MHPASQLVFLILLLPLDIFCAGILPPHDVAIRKTKFDEDHPIHPSTQPFSTQPITHPLSPPNTTTPPPLLTLHLFSLRAIITSSHAAPTISKALERCCEVFAYYLLDYDNLEEHDLVLRFGAFTLEYHDVAEMLNILAIKAVVTRVLQMVMKGLLGFVEGEVVDARAGVRMVFAFGVLGGGLGI